MSSFLENLRRHVPRCSACRCKNMKCFFVHYPRKPEIRNQKVCIVFGGSEEEVLGFEIAVDDTMVVKISNGGERGANEIGSVRFIVAALTAYAVEEFTAEGKIGDKIYWGNPKLASPSQACPRTRTIVHCFKVVDQRQYVLVAH